MTFQEFLGRFEHPKKAGNGYMVKCPAHDDKAESLSISEGADGRILLKCFAGCEAESIVSAMGLKLADLFDGEKRRAAKTVRREVAHYDYQDRDGAPLVRVVRYDPKAFGRMSPDGRGGWKWGGTGSAAALYHWPELIKACAEGCARVWLVEGEKDADNLRALGPSVVTSTALGGASKWRAEYAAEFTGAGEVFIIADNDGEANKHAGQRYAAKVRDSLRKAGINARAAVLPSIGGKFVKDASDAIAAGWLLADFEAWAEVANELQATETGEESKAIEPDDMAAAIATAITQAREVSEGHVKQEQAAEIASKVAIDWLLNHGQFFIDEELGDASGAYYFYYEQKRLLFIGGDLKKPNYFCHWLSAKSGLTMARLPFKQLFLDVQTTAIGKDCGTPFTPSRYWDYKGGKIYLSCGEGQMCRIEANKEIEIVDNGTDGVLFLPAFTLKKWALLPYEETLSPLSCDLFANMSAQTNDDENADGFSYMHWLLLFWILALPRNFKNKPPLLLCGTIGSGKTRTAQGIFELYGFKEPRILPLRDDTKGEENYWTSMNQGGLIILDNADTRCKWLADAVASAATGGTNEKRIMYENDGVFLQKARAALILTSSNPYFASDGGVADRLEVIRLERNISDTADSALSADIERKRNACLSWICLVMKGALEVEEEPTATLNRRHPDWGKWVWKCGVALGERETAEKVMQSAESDKSRIYIENDPNFSGELVRLIDKYGTFSGTAAQLVDLFKRDMDTPESVKTKINGKSLGRRLGAGWPFYESVLKARKRTLHGVVIYSFFKSDGFIVGGEAENGDDGEAGANADGEAEDGGEGQGGLF